MLRVGRRGGKSSTLSRLLVAWILWGPWDIPPGDTAMVAIVSVDREEASKRMVTIEAILAAAGVTFDKRTQAQEIHIPERRAAFAVKTCSLTGTVGFTSIAIFCDEQAKWASKEESANPAGVVMATLRPTMATQPFAFEIDCSAPWGTDDYHAKLCAEGTNETQIYDHGATWDAHPALTESRTHELEPDESEWKRAYAAIPSASLSGDWFGVSLDRALELDRCAEDVTPWVRYTLAVEIDWSRDHLSYAAVSSRAVPPDARAPDRPLRLTRVHEARIWPIAGAQPREVAFWVVQRVCARYQPETRPRVTIAEDEGHSFLEAARAAGLSLDMAKLSGRGQSGEIERYRAFRVALGDKSVQLPDESGLTSELRAVRARMTTAGNEIIELPRIKKLDGGKMGNVCRVPSLVLAVSEALLRSPQPVHVEKSEQSESERHRAAAVKEIVDKRRREWQKSPEQAMRRRMALVSR